METFYKAYTKVNQNKLHYFVKKYLSFPEFENVADILEGYGMHVDFHKACSIAGLQDETIKDRLLNEIRDVAPQAKVIELNPADEASLIKKVAP